MELALPWQSPAWASFRLSPLPPLVPPGMCRYWCMLHQFMHGVIRVVPTGSPLPKTDAEYQTMAHRQIVADAARAAALDARFTRQSAEEEGGAVVGAGDRVVQLLKFYPS